MNRSIMLRPYRLKQMYLGGLRNSLSSVLPKKDMVPIYARGERFYCAHRWTLRAFTRIMCEWGKDNPGCTPTKEELGEMVDKANREFDHIDPHIVVSEFPNKFNERLRMAGVGGVYHEAFHIVYTCKRDLQLDEIYDIVIPRWAKLDDWSPYIKFLLEWSNIIEDIKIERWGIKDYPGSSTKLHDLQDYILDSEEKSRLLAMEKGIDVSTPLKIIPCLFRDIGLGYSTRRGRDALATYKQLNPEAYDMVVNGPLSSILREAINLAKDDDLGSFRLALDVLTTLKLMGHDPKDEPELVNASGGELKCPKCDAPANKLKIRKKAKSKDNKALLICTNCGHQEEVEIKMTSSDALSSGQGIQIEIEFEDDGEEDEGEEGGKCKGKGEDGTEKSNAEKPQAGGHCYDAGPAEGNVDYTAVAQELMEEVKEGKESGRKDSLTVLEEGMKQEKEKQKKRDKLKEDEAYYQPYNTELDEYPKVEPSRQGVANDRERAARLLDSVRKQCVYMRNRLRSMVLAQEQTATLYGVPAGRRLSTRHITDTALSARNNEKVKKAFSNRDYQLDTSMSAAVVIDESGSMSSILEEATRIMMAITEPLSALNIPVQVSGFRNGKYGDSISSDNYDREDYHRSAGICHDIFKEFEENFSVVKWRFANTRSTGGTPMADGIQLGLDSLNCRDEAHRILFVITDGEPDWGHLPIIRGQLRLAKEAGIHVIGVGVGSYASGVIELYPDHVHSDHVEDIPKLLVQKLNKLLDFRGIHRGKRMRRR